MGGLRFTVSVVSLGCATFGIGCGRNTGGATGRLTPCEDTLVLSWATTGLNLGTCPAGRLNVCGIPLAPAAFLLINFIANLGAAVEPIRLQYSTNVLVLFGFVWRGLTHRYQ